MVDKITPLGQWGLLVLASLSIGTLLQFYHVPAALLLGPMIIGVILGLKGASVRVPKRGFTLAQSILGCMIAQSLSPTILPTLLQDWPLVVSILCAVLLASTLSGWLLVRFSQLPGPTGAWGSSPGGASAMVAMSADFGADVRLVAFMQYLRVLFVATAAAVVARIGLGDVSAHNTVVWFPALSSHFVTTVGLVLVGAYLGPRSRIPAGALLLPMIIGAPLHSSGVMPLQVPEWLLAIAYTLIGWSVGLRFTPAIFRLALNTLPQIILSIIGLMLFCALLALIVTKILPIDFLTAYLATSPGGLDTVAIIAAGSHVDISFVMVMQTLRLFVILLIGPVIARFISNHASAR